jgi:rare lipoprotein A
MRGLQGLWLYKVQLKRITDSRGLRNRGALWFVVLILLSMLLSSCAPKPTVYPTGARYVIASWYGPEFHGRPTASGEIFNMYAMTAAHRELPFGTKLRITNPENNRSVIVTVNDRGPFVSGRDIDLSYGAAREIGIINKGVARVLMEYVGRDTGYTKKVSFGYVGSSGPLTIQVGSFLDRSNALRLKRALEFKYNNVYITRAYIDGRTYYRVRIGEFRDRQSAYSFARGLAMEGYNTLITTMD